MDTPSARASMAEVEQIEVTASPPLKPETVAPMQQENAAVPGHMLPAEAPDELIVTPPAIEEGRQKQTPPTEAKAPEMAARVQLHGDTGDSGVTEGQAARRPKIGPRDGISVEVNFPEQARPQPEKASLRISAQPDAPAPKDVKAPQGEAPASEVNGTALKPEASAIPKATDRQEGTARLVVLAEERPEQTEREAKTVDGAATNREPRRPTEVIEMAGQVVMPELRPERAAELEAVVQRHVLGLEAVALLHQIEGAARRAAKLSRVTVHLRPPDLGSINISVESREGNLSARFQASHPLVAAWLESNVGTLRTHLAEAGLPFGEVNCSLTADQRERGWAGERPARTWSPPDEGTTTANGIGKPPVIEHAGLADWRA